ncbi:hypothetical protein [Salinisphaera aquimarina]|uniref:Uncharacterized protein n=1 Tax=Salinisphaera aquimarina TaxID=2094031 RepID=A0ABV7EQI5_9GAMM
MSSNDTKTVLPEGVGRDSVEGSWSGAGKLKRGKLQTTSSPSESEGDNKPREPETKKR